MTKRETIDRIVAHNPSAKPEFLAQFTAQQLHDYLRQLELLITQPVGNIAAGASPEMQT